MKQRLILLVMMLLGVRMAAQETYWVLLRDKAGSTFDPYAYFDPKAIARYERCGADLWDASNYPLSAAYVSQVEPLCEEVLAESRWLNALAVSAMPEQAEAIAALPCVINMIHARATLHPTTLDEPDTIPSDTSHLSPLTSHLSPQLRRMQGELFRERGLDGTGVRIAVIDLGFNKADRHAALRHLWENHQVLNTFTTRKKDSLDFHGQRHGTQVLGCLAGMDDSIPLGLATGAEYLLAQCATMERTDYLLMPALEWADKEGAQIVNISLGIHGDYLFVDDMDGQSLASREATMAARKGLLLCVAAGNEGKHDRWHIITSPGDADSVLTVGAITSWSYEPTYYTSVGPTYDGRRKPNVCAVGDVETIDASDTCGTSFQKGTSFATPLVAGFAACVWQAHPELTNMELLEALERSADRYPYYDYTLGYGVPQASYFLLDTIAPPDTTFRFIEEEDTLRIRLSWSLKEMENNPSKETLFFRLDDSTGRIVRHYGVNLAYWTNDSTAIHEVSIPLCALKGYTLVAHCGGYTAEYRTERQGNACPFSYRESNMIHTVCGRTLEDERMPLRPMHYEGYLNYSFRRTWELGTGLYQPVRHNFGVGLTIDLLHSGYRLRTDEGKAKLGQWEGGVGAYLRIGLKGNNHASRVRYCTFGGYLHSTFGERYRIRNGNSTSIILHPDLPLAPVHYGLTASYTRGRWTFLARYRLTPETLDLPPLTLGVTLLSLGSRP